jgi:hypothetical protein
MEDLQLHLNDSSSQRSSQIAHIDLPSLFLRMKQWPSTHFVNSLSLTGCTIMCGMIVLAANVLCAYTLGAYVEAVCPFDRFEVDKLAWWPMTEGWLGLRIVPMRSKPNCGSVLVRSCRGLRGLSIGYTEELRRPMPSAKCPDRFSRKVACSANPESFLDCAPLEKFEAIGDGATGDGGEALDEWL